MATDFASARELIEAARKLQPALADRATAVEEGRRIPDETIATLEEQGFFKYLLTKRWGGAGGSIEGFITIAAELAKGDGSTAWVYSLLGGQTAVLAAFVPPEGEELIFGSGESVLATGSISGGGTARPTNGGWIVSGKWGYSTGSLHANWFFGNVKILDERSETVGQGLVFIPISDLTVHDTWFTVGMRGTGSNNIDGSEIFVPGPLVLDLADRVAQEANPPAGADLLQQTPFAPYFSIAIVGTHIGIAEGVYEHVVQNFANKGVPHWKFGTKVDSAVLVQALGEARIKIDTAWLHAQRGAQTLQSVPEKGPLTLRERARTRADAGTAAQYAHDAVEILLDVAGSSSFAESNPLQRHWRDLGAASRHTFLGRRLLQELYGRVELGLEPEITPYI